MPVAPITIKPTPRKIINLKANELFAAIREYLLVVEGLRISDLFFEPDTSVGWTDIYLEKITKDGSPWHSGRFLFFRLDGHTIRAEGTRIGRGPFDAIIKMSRTSDEASRDEPCKEIYNVHISVNDDRSFTFS